MTSRPERLSPKEVGISEVLINYSIPPLPSLDVEVSVLDGKITPFSLRKVIELSPDEIMRKPLNMMRAEEVAVVPKKKHGRERSRPEMGAIRSDYRKMKQSLRFDGPGEVLAAIALNAGKARWTSSGLAGEGWVDLPEEERLWWSWVYAKEQKEVDVERFLSNEREGNILRAVFLMRFRQNKGLISQDEFDRFLTEVSPLIPGKNKEFISLLGEITQKFPTPFSNEQKRILQLF
ncbi:MAG TPA: hypothetical protein VMX76_02590 [Nevskiaceae bacterium]|nr:hypothetical protein [Nevskiaceae bacterium]